MFEKCSCGHCSGHIEFDSEHAGQMVACPHCGLETKLYVPKVPLNKPSLNVSVEIKRGVNPLGIASLVLGIGACVFCWIPFLGLLAIPFAAIGLLLAVIGITASIVGKKSSLSFPISGAVVCIVATLIALFVTGGISRLIVKQADQANSTNQKSESSSGEENWSKSDTVQQENIKIKIAGWSWSDVVFIDNPMGGVTPYQGYYTIKLNLSNLSNTKKIDFTTWRGETLSASRDYATLTDDNGNVYKRINFGLNTISGRQNETSIYPNQSYQDLLVFEKPVSNLKWLHLELPASNFGGSGMIRFEIHFK